MKSKLQIEETVARIMTLPEKEQVRQLAETLDALPEEGRQMIVAYLRMAKEESLARDHARPGLLPPPRQRTPAGAYFSRRDPTVGMRCEPEDRIQTEPHAPCNGCQPQKNG